MKPRYLLFIAAYFIPFIGMWLYIQHAYIVMSSSARLNSVNVLDLGATGDGIKDDGDSFTAAFSLATKYNIPVVIPKRTYVVNRQLDIAPGMIIRSDGATLIHTNSAETILAASDVNDWVIQGPLTLSGTRTTSSQQDKETGLFISGGNRYIVDKVTIMNFSGKGIEITTGKTGWTARGDHGKFAFISFINNSVGLQIDESIGAEYNLFTLLSFSGNDVATNISAGNNIITASNIVDNGNGVQLSEGSNHGHGIFSATNINHNTGFNIKSDNVTSGYTFNACHIYGNSSTNGVIRLTGSSGIQMTGGTIDAAIIDDGGGLNMLSDNFVAGDKFGITGNNQKSILQQLLFTANQIASSNSK